MCVAVFATELLRPFHLTSRQIEAAQLIPITNVREFAIDRPGDLTSEPVNFGACSVAGRFAGVTLVIGFLLHLERCDWGQPRDG